MRLPVALVLSVSLAAALTGSGPVFPYGDNNGLPEPPCEHTTKIFFASIYTSATGGLVARANLSAVADDGTACRLTKDVNNLNVGQTYYYVVEANAQNPDGSYRQTNCWGCGASTTDDTRQDTCDGVPVCTFKLTTSNTINIEMFAVVTNNSNFLVRATETAISGQRVTAQGAGATPVSLGNNYVYNHKAFDEAANNWDHGSGTTVPLVWSWGYDNPRRWAAVDTTGNNGSPNAFRISYPGGLSSPAATPGTTAGGLGFYERYAEIQSYTTVRLTYEVSFGNAASPSSNAFKWVKGGKLPGLYGGIQTSSGAHPYGQSCSGGYDGAGCFSCRLMWRADGMGEAYIYYDRNMKQDPSLFNVAPKSIENKDDGDSIGRGAWNFPTGGPGDYATVSMTIRLNDVVSGTPKANGHLNVTYNGQQMITFTKLKWRATTAVKFSGIFFSSFFGGSTLEWAPDTDQNARFRNFKVEYGNPTYAN